MTVYYIDPKYIDLAKKNNINLGTFRQRVYDFGWEPERAATQPPHKRTDRKEWGAIAKTNGIGYQTFLQRVNKLGWEIERAATEPIKSRKEVASMGGKAHGGKTKITKYIRELAEKNGVNYKTLHARVHRLNWEPERAATTPVIPTDASCQNAREAYKRKYGHYWHGCAAGAFRKNKK